MEASIDSLNRESGLSLRLVTDETNAFSSWLAYCRRFPGARSCITLSGPKGMNRRACCYGEYAQTIGL